MADFQQISEFVQKGRARNVKELVSSALAEGVSAKDILNEGLIAGMTALGIRFRNNEVYVPEVLVAARAMNQGVELLRPYLSAEGVKPVGKAVICTVSGDHHDIGKNLVKMMLEGSGIECVDLGTDASAEQIVSAVQESGAQLVCLSALLTTTMVYQKDVIEALSAAGLRDKVKVMVGGAPVTAKFAAEIGADAYTEDAAEAAQVALQLLGA